MFDFKLLVESLLLEEVNPLTIPVIENLVNAIKVKYLPAINESIYKKVADIALNAVAVRLTKDSFASIDDYGEGAFVLLSALLELRLKYLGRDGARFTEGSNQVEEMYNNEKVKEKAVEITNKITDNTFEFITSFNFVNAYKNFLNDYNSLRQKIGFAALREHENKTILAATIDIINKRTNSRSNTFITDLFYDPVKYFSGGNIPSDITKSINVRSLIELAVDTKALYKQLQKSAEAPAQVSGQSQVPESFKYKKRILKEDLIVPLVFAIGAAAIAGGKIIYDKIKTDNIHKGADDQSYVSFLRTGKLVKPQDSKSNSVLYNYTYTLKQINELVNTEPNIKWAKNIIDHLMNLTDYQVSKDSTSSSIGGAIGSGLSDLMSKGIGGSVSWR